MPYFLFVKSKSVESLYGFYMKFQVIFHEFLPTWWREEGYSGVPKISIRNLDFSYPKPAQAEVNFLRIKVATLKEILKTSFDDDYYRDELHTYEVALEEAKREKSQKGETE